MGLREDLATTIQEVRENGGSIDEKAHILQRITAEELRININNRNFFTLGLLYNLVEHAKKHYDTLSEDSRPPWMEYYAGRNETNFKVTGKSINQIPANFFAGYILFLDEFKAKECAIFVRNLARAIGIRCCVSNTNAKVVNLVGKHQSIMSGSSAESVWSIVVTELKLGNYETLNSLTQIDEKVEWIAENVISDEFSNDKALFLAFFKDFKDNQVSKMRPGVSLFVAEFLNVFVQIHSQRQAKMSFESFFSQLVNHISKDLATRKPTVKSSIQGKAATLSLLLSPSYDRGKVDKSLNGMINYLEKHFYYLVNPSNASNWLFLTFASQSQNVSFPLDFMKDQSRKTWEAELTYFKSEEILTILACMNLLHYKRQSFSLILDGIFQVTKTYNYNTTATINPLAEKRDGNILEVLSTLCVSHSSHHDPLKEINSFKGQSGSKFISNLLSDLKFSRSEHEIELGYNLAELENFNIRNFLEDKVLVPFLYVSNFELPNVFHEMMLNSNIRNRSINIGKITRTTNKSKIDIQFQFYYCLNQKFNCNMECKNWKVKVSYPNLLEIFQRAISQDINDKHSINIIICNELNSPPDKTYENFSEYCMKNRINAYRFDRTNPLLWSTFSLIPINEYLSNEPSLIALIIELKFIDLVQE